MSIFCSLLVSQDEDKNMLDFLVEVNLIPEIGHVYTVVVICEEQRMGNIMFGYVQEELIVPNIIEGRRVFKTA